MSKLHICHAYPDSGLLCIHNFRRRVLGVDGYAHTRPIEDEPKHKTKDYPSEKLAAKRAYEISVCLQCTRKDCTGGDECFKGYKQKEVSK